MLRPHLEALSLGSSRLYLLPTPGLPGEACFGRGESLKRLHWVPGTAPGMRDTAVTKQAEVPARGELPA